MLAIANRPLDADMLGILYDALDWYRCYRAAGDERPRVELLMELIRRYLADELERSFVDAAADSLCL